MDIDSQHTGQVTGSVQSFFALVNNALARRIAQNDNDLNFGGQFSSAYLHLAEAWSVAASVGAFGKGRSLNKRGKESLVSGMLPQNQHVDRVKITIPGFRLERLLFTVKLALMPWRSQVFDAC